MSEEDPFKRKYCQDCRFLQVAGNPICTNGEAMIARKTQTPDAYNCPYWKPDPEELSKADRKRIEEGYTPPPGFFRRLFS